MVSIDLERRTVDVEGTALSVLCAGEPTSPPLLLLHGTFWSRVWQPVLPALGEHWYCLALDFPGFGLSEGELGVEQASAPSLARTTQLAADALGLESYRLAAHDIGGAVAQQLVVHSPQRVSGMVLMNAVMLDSWPVPAVEKFRDPQVRAATSVSELLEARRTSLTKAVERPLSAAETEDYLSPWQEESRARSWMAMAAAADPAYTLDLVPSLIEHAVPTRLVWGRDDTFQRLEFARRYVEQIPGSDLVQVPGRHIPTEDSPALVAAAMIEHLSSAPA